MRWCRGRETGHINIVNATCPSNALWVSRPLKSWPAALFPLFLLFLLSSSGELLLRFSLFSSCGSPKGGGCARGHGYGVWSEEEVAIHTRRVPTYLFHHLRLRERIRSQESGPRVCK
ncbi:hypothetical protein Taro_023008 [Colocasia esculenta]|uniref:Uncharacterized protein n=1 Tax=Colocasia esculenta TaxID=4460 RepID=A0A843UW56_COLES|nr:hypothetical protein [Colocasia esculenta]